LPGCTGPSVGNSASARGWTTKSSATGRAGYRGREADSHARTCYFAFFAFFAAPTASQRRRNMPIAGCSWPTECFPCQLQDTHSRLTTCEESVESEVSGATCGRRSEPGERPPHQWCGIALTEGTA
jgi:hypothetical protein